MPEVKSAQNSILNNTTASNGKEPFIISKEVKERNKLRNIITTRTDSNTSPTQLSPPSAMTPSVSFCINKNEAISHHRHSISTVPKKSKESSAPVSPETELEEKNCTVHMPGDFVYLNKKKEMSPQLSEDLTNKVIFKKKNIIAEPMIPFTEFFEQQDDKKFHILLGATGSVATIKIPLIIDKLFKIYSPEKISIQLIVTKPAEHFLNGLKISSKVKIWREEDSIADCNGELMLFHELKRWADIFLIAPLSANTLAKLANGICNNLLTSVIRDWTDYSPILVAPAMNTFMYINPMTRKHLNILKENFPFIEILKPVEKVLICGDIGMGGMREWSDIVEILRYKVKEIHKMRNEMTADNEDKEDAKEKKMLENEEEDDDGEEDEDDDDDDDDEKDDGDETDPSSNSISDWDDNEDEDPEQKTH